VCGKWGIVQYRVSGSTLGQPSSFFSCRPNGLELSPGFCSPDDALQTISDVYLERICLLDTSASSALGVLDDNCAV